MKKGVSLIALLSTVIVLGIIASVVVVSGYDIITEADKREFTTEILSLQKVIQERISVDGEEKILGEKVLIDESANTKPNFLGLVDAMVLEPYNQNNVKELFKIKLENLGIENLRRGNKQNGEDDIYLYSKVTGKVYYKNGEKIGGSFYYTYSNDLFEVVEASFNDYYPKLSRLNFFDLYRGVSVAEDVEGYADVYDVYVKIQPGIEFKYIREDAKLENNMIGNQPLSVPTQTIEYGDMKLVRVETSKLDSMKGFTIYISGTSLEYYPGKVDKNPPNINSGSALENQTYYVKDETGSNVYIDLTGLIKDNKSGVKVVKYLYGNQPMEAFVNGGITVTNNKIQIERQGSLDASITITLYCEDNAGNKTRTTYKIPDKIIEESGI